LASYVLAHGVDVNAQNSRGQSALGAAASGGKTEVALLLLAKGARIDTRSYPLGETPLTQAAQMNHLDMVKLLVDSGADPNERQEGGCRCNALDWAIKQGNQEMADFLRSRMNPQ
jgi:ankyrin repeat protein